MSLSQKSSAQLVALFRATDLTVIDADEPSLERLFEGMISCAPTRTATGVLEERLGEVRREAEPRVTQLRQGQGERGAVNVVFQPLRGPKGAVESIAMLSIEVADQNPLFAEVYAEICRAHQGITDFRAKLLAALPIVSGAALSLVVANGQEIELWLLLPFGLFGALVSAGLFLYELRGIQVCKSLRERAAALEAWAGQPVGPFMLRPGKQTLRQAFGGSSSPGQGWIGAETASHVVYLTVICAWLVAAAVGLVDVISGV